MDLAHRRRHSRRRRRVRNARASGRTSRRTLQTRCPTPRRARSSTRTAIAFPRNSPARPGGTRVELATVGRGHDAKTRARLARGDEDSIVNFWMFGTSFTSRPRATVVDLGPRGGRAAAAEVLIGRLDDLITALSSPVSNERLVFVRDALQQRGLDVTTAAGRDRARAYLIDAHERILAENEGYRRSAESASGIPDEGARLARFASVYSDRGLSSDTSLPIDFALDETLSAAKSRRHLAAPVRRVAVIGPGLDFTDKADGYDFYPVQTMSHSHWSTRSYGLVSRRPTTCRSPRRSSSSTRHIQEAGVRAARGTPYTLQLPIVTNDPAHHWSRASSVTGSDAATRSARRPPGWHRRAELPGSVCVPSMCVPRWS